MTFANLASASRKGDVPAAHAEGQNDLPLFRSGCLQSPNQRYRHQQNREVGGYVEGTSGQHDSSVIDTGSTRDCYVPTIFDRCTLEDAREGKRDGPAHHECTDHPEAISKALGYKDLAVHRQDADLDQSHGETVRVLVGNVELSPETSQRTFVWKRAIQGAMVSQEIL